MLTANQYLILDQLENAAKSGNAQDAETAILLTFSEFEQDKEFQVHAVPALLKILTYLNHYRHEDIVRLLQEAKDSRAVDTLYKAALVIPEYQEEYDGGAALARKCTWALADIGNAEAYHKLLLLAKNNNPEIAGYAQRRIGLWEKELPRKSHCFKP
jgi:hypothetical protein